MPIPSPVLEAINLELRELEAVALRELLAAHYSDERGVVLDSRSWLIAARRRR